MMTQLGTRRHLKMWYGTVSENVTGIHRLCEYLISLSSVLVKVIALTQIFAFGKLYNLFWPVESEGSKERTRFYFWRPEPLKGGNEVGGIFFWRQEHL